MIPFWAIILIILLIIGIIIGLLSDGDGLGLYLLGIGAAVIVVLIIAGIGTVGLWVLDKWRWADWWSWTDAMIIGLIIIGLIILILVLSHIKMTILGLIVLIVHGSYTGNMDYTIMFLIFGILVCLIIYEYYVISNRKRRGKKNDDDNPLGATPFSDPGSPPPTGAGAFAGKKKARKIIELEVR